MSEIGDDDDDEVTPPQGTPMPTALVRKPGARTVATTAGERHTRLLLELVKRIEARMAEG